MRLTGKRLRRIAIWCTLVLLAVWFFWPREPVDTDVDLASFAVPEDINAHLSAREAAFSNLTEGVAKRVIWAGEPDTLTDYVVLYVHGFSATSEEIRPVPDIVAQALGANLFFTRLSGHGRGPLAMVEPVAGDWVEDMAEALVIAERLGKKVIVIATSTGGTLAAIAAQHPELSQKMDAVIFVSPNFRIKNLADTVLEWPLARTISVLVSGAERSLAPLSEAHQKYWTTIYPTTALIPMAALVRHARRLDYTQVTQPALFVFSDDDAVVDAETTRAMSTKWGGPVTLAPVVLEDGDDPFNHIIAGDILSPGKTEDVAQLMIDWIGEL